MFSECDLAFGLWFTVARLFRGEVFLRYQRKLILQFSQVAYV
jgi:hypothetical protein